MGEEKKTNKGRIDTKRSLFFILVFSIAILGASIYWFVIENEWLSKDFRKQIEIEKQQDKFDDLYLNIQSAESAVRAYASTGNKKYIKDIRLQLNAIRSNYQELRAFLNNDISTISASVFVSFDSLIKEKIAFMETAKKLCDENNCTGALELIATEKGIELTTAILTVNQNTNRKLRESLNVSKERFARLNKRNNNIAYAGIAAALLTILIIIYLLRKEIQRTKYITEQLQVQRDYLGITLNSIAEGLIATDKESRIVFMNPVAERLTGWTNQEARNQPLETVYKVFNEETGKPFDNIIKRILNEGVTIAFENNTILKNRKNESLIISNTGSPLKNKDGKIEGAVLVFNNITENIIDKNKLKQSELEFRDLIYNLPEAIYTCDKEGYIQIYNNAAVKLWGKEPVAGKDKWCGSWKIFNTDGSELPLDKCPMAITLKEAKPVYGREVLVQRPDGAMRFVLPSPTPMFNEEGNLTGAVNMLIDVTAKKEREILIRKTEEKYKNLIEQASDAIVVYSMDGTIHEFNNIICSLTGYSREEFKTLKINDLLIGKLIENEDKYKALMANDVVTLYRQIKNKEDNVFDLEVRAKTIGDGKILAICRDVTDRNKADKEKEEKNKQLQLLAEHLQNVREEERTSIAREIHDELGQQLTIMKMDVTWLEENLVGENEKLLIRCNELKKMLDLTVSTVRRIAYQLRPSLLDDMGLDAAIEWQLNEFEKRSGVATTYKGVRSKLPIPDNAKTGLFRIVQESLTNVVRYAKANNVNVRLGQVGDKVELIIADDGVGFDIEKLSEKKTFGIVGMKERCIMLGGEFKIESLIGMGTKITISTPVINNQK